MFFADYIENFTTALKVIGEALANTAQPERGITCVN